jgi:hypothetical protein
VGEISEGMEHTEQMMKEVIYENETHFHSERVTK